MDPIVIAAFLVGALAGGGVIFFVRRHQQQSEVEKRATALLGTKQEAFIAIASHYLLTPISIIQSAVMRLSEKPSLELSERVELYNTIITGEKRLYIIAEQMLLATKLVNGQLNISAAVGQIHTPVVEAIAEIETIANQKKVGIKTDIQQNPPIECQFDAKQIKTAVVALLDNAVKFSHEKGLITVTVQHKGNNAFISVSDNGIGFTPEQQAHATDKFYRGTPPYVFDYEGMGLGLHVAYVIMQAHGGDLLVESAGKEKGSTVSLVLPLTLR